MALRVRFEVAVRHETLVQSHQGVPSQRFKGESYCCRDSMEATGDSGLSPASHIYTEWANQDRLDLAEMVKGIIHGLKRNYFVPPVTIGTFSEWENSPRKG